MWLGSVNLPGMPPRHYTQILSYVIYSTYMSNLSGGEKDCFTATFISQAYLLFSSSASSFLLYSLNQNMSKNNTENSFRFSEAPQHSLASDAGTSICL